MDPEPNRIPEVLLGLSLCGLIGLAQHGPNNVGLYSAVALSLSSVGLSSAVALSLAVGLSHLASRASRCSLFRFSLVVGLSHASRWVSLSLSALSIVVARRNQFAERNCSIIMSCSSTSENRTRVKACEKCSNSNKVLRISHTRENPNRKFWKCKGCGAFEWDDDRKSSECNDFGGMEDRSMNESKIDILLGKVRRLGHQM
ncbi:hypothetical protein WN943_018877 [Citrus x changshan-huyou]